MSRLWDRGEPLHALVLHYSAGEDALLDQELVPYDLSASAAHAQMLYDSGYLSVSQREALAQGLTTLAKTHAAGEWAVTLEDEDCHTAIENRLVALTGDAGRAIHLGRSRNDQVLAALRLWLKARLDALASQAGNVAEALEQLATRHEDWPLPGYTHMQRAMPSTVGLWARGFAAELRDDACGLATAKRRADKNPLGSAAGYGVPVLSLSRESTTRQLGFAVTHTPVTAVQLSRGKAEATALFEATLMAQDLGRLAADLCLFNTSEFGFVTLPPAFTTGSSMLPQKRNPDIFELARGRTAEACAALQEVLAVTSKLTSGYHRDLQLIKKPLFRGLSAVSGTAAVLCAALPELRFDAERMRAAIDPSLLLAEQAYRLVHQEQIPFREAYQRVRSSQPACG